MADVEVVERALSLSAPVAVGGDLDLAHAIGFGASGRGHASIVYRTIFQDEQVPDQIRMLVFLQDIRART